MDHSVVSKTVAAKPLEWCLALGSTLEEWYSVTQHNVLKLVTETDKA